MRKATISATNMEQNFSNAPLRAEKAERLDTPSRLHIHSRRHRLVDSDGVSAKAAIDGLVHAGLLEDDSAQYVKEVTYSQEKIGKREIEETIITIHSI